MRSQKGFTLVELIVVIAIIGILAAFAIPRYVSLVADARAANINAVAGSMRSSVAVCKAKYRAVGDTAAVTVELEDGTAVDVSSGTGSGAGIPEATATGIEAALDLTAGVYTFTHAAPSTTVQLTADPVATCQAVYNETTGAVVITITDC